ncbi:hypothetical protein G7Y79_00026g058190 [Physcia stellaris]|nr:hypothetical protein G7Y79_00026g058190 [Physcia stellaris]
MPRHDESPKGGVERHFDAMLPRVVAASRRLQNATDVRNEDAWPTPSKRAVEIDQLTYAVNVAILDDAIQACGKFYVDMNRESARGEVLDNAVKGLEKRKIKVAIKAKNEETRATVADEAYKGNKKKKKPKKGKEKETAIMTVEGQDASTFPAPSTSMQANGSPTRSGVIAEIGNETAQSLPIVISGTPSTVDQSDSPASSSSVEILSVESASSATESTGQNTSRRLAIDIKQGSDGMDINIDDADPILLGAQTVGNDSLNEEQTPVSRVPRKYPRFPDPQMMNGSFTDAICQYDDFTVKPILALTLKDVTPLMHIPNRERCILLKHFEVGLDGIEAIVAGEVIIPESLFWKKQVREDRLGKLGTLKSGRGGYSKELEDHQRRCHYGEGRWIFFGIKFKQSHSEKKKGKGKWGCFGAPLEAVQRFDAVEEQIAVGGGTDIKGKAVPSRSERFLRTNVKFSSGGVPCMDLWNGAEEWDDGVWIEVRKAMASSCLVVNTLYQTKDQKNPTTAGSSSTINQPHCKQPESLATPSTRSSSPINKMDGSADIKAKRKRGHSTAGETPGKGEGCKKTKSKPLEEDEVGIIQEMLANQTT